MNTGEYDYITAVQCDTTQLMNIISALQSTIKENESNQTESGRWLKAYSDRHLNFAINTRAECLRNRGDLVGLKNWYNSWAIVFPTDLYYKIKSAEVSFQMGNINIAKSEIDFLKSNNNTITEVLEALKISMDISQTTNNLNLINVVDENDIYYRRNTLSAENLQLLQRVAVSSNPFAAYGRAMLNYLTGEKLEPTVNYSIIPNQKINKVSSLEPEFNISPNPSNGILNINASISDFTHDHTYYLTNTLGHHLLGGKIENEMTQLDVSNVANGIYFLTIKIDGLINKTQKVIIQK